jgi:hypothetical protein
MPAVFGVAWPDPAHLTLSLVPDGTATAAGSSGLFAQLGSGNNAWQLEILRAFQTWAVQANINIGLVSDNGNAFGTLEVPQGQQGTGDIRIGSAALGTSQLAVTMPYSPTSNWSGDLLLNSASSFSVGGTASSADLFTVALHEAGHALGIGDNTDPTSAMFEDYAGPRTGLSSGDIAQLLSLYAPRTPDALEGAAGNNTAATATPLSFATDSTAAVRADLTTKTDVDFYTVQAPATGPFTVALRTSGISLLEARLTVLDSTGQVLGTAQASDPRQGDLAVTVNGQAGATYTIRVDGPTGDVFAVGAYRLAAGTAAGQAVTATPSCLFNVDNHSNDTIATATVLPRRYTTTDGHSDYLVKASLQDSQDVDVYQVQATQSQFRQQTIMAVTVWATVPQTINPVVTIYDTNGHLVTSQVLLTANGVFAVQVPNVKDNALYYVSISGMPLSGSSGVGNYDLSVDFQNAAMPSFTISDKLGVAQRAQDFETLTVQASQLFHFELTATQNRFDAPSAVQMVNYDASGNVDFATVALPGVASRNDVWLAAGTYTVRLWAFSVLGGTVGPISYLLAGYSASDPIGLTPVDTTLNATTTSTSGSSSPGTTSPTYSYNWTTTDPTVAASLVTVLDPLSTDWWM